MRSEKVYAENFEQAINSAPDIGSIDFAYGIVATKNATRIGPNLWRVDIWHQSDGDEVATDSDEVHPLIALTVVSACLLLVLAVIVALVNGVALLVKLVFGWPA